MLELWEDCTEEGTANVFKMQIGAYFIDLNIGELRT